MRKFFEARYILRRYRAHVEEVADILLAQKELSEADGAKLFHKWGEPDLDILDNYDSSRNYKKSMDIFMPLTQKEENEVSRIRHVTNFCMDLHFDEKIGNDSVRIVRYHAGRSVMDWYLRTIPDEDAELLRLASGFAAAFRRTPLVFDRMVKMWLERPDQYSFHNPELCAGFKNLQGGCLARRGGAKSAAKLMIRSYYRARTILKHYDAVMEDAIRRRNETGKIDFSRWMTPARVFSRRKRLAHICRRITLNWN